MNPKLSKLLCTHVRSVSQVSSLSVQSPINFSSAGLPVCPACPHCTEGGQSPPHGIRNRPSEQAQMVRSKGQPHLEGLQFVSFDPFPAGLKTLQHPQVPTMTYRGPKVVHTRIFQARRIVDSSGIYCRLLPVRELVDG